MEDVSPKPTWLHWILLSFKNLSKGIYSSLVVVSKSILRESKDLSANLREKQYRGFVRLLSFICVAILVSPILSKNERFQAIASHIYQENQVIIYAEADSYVCGPGSTCLTRLNYGGEPDLLVKDNSEISFIRFRISSNDFPPSAIITSAAVQLFYNSSTGYDQIALNVYSAVNDWDEYQITSAYSPSYWIQPINTSPITITSDDWGSYINIATLTTYSDWQYDPDDVYTYVIKGIPNNSPDSSAIFSSREGQYPPRILISYYIPATETPTPTDTSTITPTNTPTRTPTYTSTSTNTPIQTSTTTWTQTQTSTLTPTGTPTPTYTSTNIVTYTSLPPSTFTSVPIVSPGSGVVPRQIKDILLTFLVILICVLFLVYFISKSSGKPTPSDQLSNHKPDQPPNVPPDTPRRMGIPPGPPPLRLLRIWLTENGTGRGNPITDNMALVNGKWYSLHVQIRVRGIEYTNEIQTGNRIPLNVVLFSPDIDFVMERSTAVIEIPNTGNSTMIHMPFRPLQIGKRSIRVCIYYHNVLLQSAVLELTVVLPSRAGTINSIPVNSRLLDYVASQDLIRLDQFRNPSLSIFTNEVTDGSHWIGIYAATSNTEKPIFHELFVFDSNELSNLARIERDSLMMVQGRKYRLDYALPLDNRSIRFCEEHLVDLAITGFRLLNRLFLDDPTGLGQKRLKELNNHLKSPGLISISRCRGKSTTFPWAALYTFPLDENSHRNMDIHLCEKFKHELCANRWSDHTLQSPIQDHLDAPQTCLSSADCPIRVDSRRIVCPFGFWGFMHIIEQPLQQIKPTSADKIPEEVKRRNFGHDQILILKHQQKVRCAIGINPTLDPNNQVYTEIRSMDHAGLLDIECSNNSKNILKQIMEGGRHLYYFFCHGVIEEHSFRLKFSPDTISSASLYPLDINWPDQPKPLFILNACETTAVTPEIIYGFLEKLRSLGAVGVVGTEIPIATIPAKMIGSLLIYYLLNGNSIGEAFLKLRRHMQRQGNPLGLVYTFYAWADLHLHLEGNCVWCNTHSLRIKQGRGET